MNGRLLGFAGSQLLTRDLSSSEGADAEDSEEEGDDDSGDDDDEAEERLKRSRLSRHKQKRGYRRQKRLGSFMKKFNENMQKMNEDTRNRIMKPFVGFMPPNIDPLKPFKEKFEADKAAYPKNPRNSQCPTGFRAYGNEDGTFCCNGKVSADGQQCTEGTSCAMPGVPRPLDAKWTYCSGTGTISCPKEDMVAFSGEF